LLTLLNTPSLRVTHTHRTHLPIAAISVGKRTGPLHGLNAEVHSRLGLCLQ